MEKQTTKVIVIGAGYAGLLAAVRLAMKTRQQNLQITLINSSGFFVERPRLHQFAANQKLRQRPIAKVLEGTGVKFLQADLEAIHAPEREVLINTPSGSRALAYDYLLYAAGSTIELDRVPGVRENAYSLTPAGLRSAVALKTALPRLNRQSGQLVVVGGGPTGIEAAAEFAESYPNLHVTLVTEGELAQAFGDKIKAHIRKALGSLGVEIRDHLQVESILPNQLIIRSGEPISFDICLWAGGFVASPLARDAGLMVNNRGQLLVDPFMRSISDMHIYAAGDSAHPELTSGIPVRMAAYTAAIMGAHAADCLANAILGKPQTPLNFAYLGQGIALGRHDAVDFNNFPDDQPRPPMFTGPAAVIGRDFFVNLLAALPAFERRLPGLHFWPVSHRSKLALQLPEEENQTSW